MSRLATLARSTSITSWALALCLLLNMSGCAVMSVVDAAAAVASTAVSVGATVVSTTVDVAAAGVKAAQ